MQIYQSDNLLTSFCYPIFRALCFVWCLIDTVMDVICNLDPMESCFLTDAQCEETEAAIVSTMYRTLLLHIIVSERRSNQYHPLEAFWERWD